MTGLHLAQYRIDAELGRGGMGIVYRATDTKLDRTVALKVLPPHALSSADDRTRFYREARAAASLNHPHIATIHQIDEAPLLAEGEKPAPDAEARPFIAMEYVDGESLAERIAKGPLKLDEAIRVASQVAEALGAAHEAGIVHRDVKSGNVMLTSKGVAKVLDFGLAKTNASTQLTRQGSTLGTVAYMSPEQARGQEVDGRTDLYSLGTVLYEMVVGRLPFAGEYEQAILYGILNEPPEPLTAVRTGVPMDLERLVNKLLTKEADYRYQTAADLIADLRSLDMSGSGRSQFRTGVLPSSGAGTHVVAGSRIALPKGVYGAIAGALILGAAGSWWVANDAERVPAPVRHLMASLLPASRIYPTLSISADGSAIAYVALENDGAHLRVRDLDEREGREVSRGEWLAQPALSPDGRWIAYTVGGALYRVSTSGGSPELIRNFGYTLVRVAWASNEEMIAGVSDRGLVFISEQGQETPIGEEVPDGFSAIHPTVVPGTRVVLYTRWASGTSASEVWAHDVDSGRSALVVARAVMPKYHPDGYVLFYRGRDVYGARFDTGTLETGPAFIVQPDVANLSDGLVVLYDLSQTDLFVYFRDGIFGSAERNLIVQAPGGPPSTTLVEAKDYWDPRFSPDGNSVLAHATGGNGDTEVWLIDLARGAARPVTNNPGEDETPVWAPDGRSFYYSTDGGGFEVLARRSVTGVGAVDTLRRWNDHLHVESVSSDERYVVVTLGRDSQDLELVDLQQPDRSIPLFETGANETAGKISPDGRWLAYQSDESGSPEIYLATFPSSEVVARVSTDGGETPVWSRDGRTLYFVRGSTLFEVSMADPGNPGTPRAFIDSGVGFFRQPPHTTYDVFDGKVIFSNAPQGSVSESNVEVISGIGSLLRSLDTGSAP